MSNPHALFITLLIVSLSLTSIALLSSNKMDELVSMLTILVPALTIAALVLVFTRKYWEGLRRI